MTETHTIIGVIAGTPFDTHLGTSKVEQMGLKALSRPISQDPQKQTLLQIDKKLLTKKVSSAIEELIKKGASSVVLYCHSISLAIDMDYVKQRQKCRIISPTNILKTLKIKGNSIGVLSANCQTVGRIEQIILKNNPHSSIVGLGLMPLVKTIEQKTSPIDIIETLGLIELCRFFTKAGCHELILGCTHFECLYPKLSEMILKRNMPIKIIPVFNLMLETLLE